MGRANKKKALNKSKKVRYTKKGPSSNKESAPISANTQMGNFFYM